MHRMVGAVMAELHLDGLRARREAQQLVAEADAEDRHVRLPRNSRSPRSRSRRAPDRPGPFDRNTPSGLSASTSARRRLRRHHRHAAAVVGEQPQDVALDAEVVGHDVQALAGPRGAAAARAPSSCPRSTGRLRLRRDDLGEVHALEARERARGRAPPGPAASHASPVMMQPACAPFSRRMPRQLARVDARRWRPRCRARRNSASDSVARQLRVQQRQIADHQAGGIDRATPGPRGWCRYCRCADR